MPKPKKIPKSFRLHIVLEQNVIALVKQSAEKESRSVSNWIKSLILEHFKEVNSQPSV